MGLFSDTRQSYNLLSSVYKKYLPKKEKKINIWVSLWYNSYDFFTVRELTNWLVGWISDSTVQGLTNWLNDLWLVDWQNNITDATVRTDHWSKLFMAGWLTDWLTFCTVWRLTNWLNGLWLVDWLTNWCYCLTTNQHSEWFIVGWLTE